MLDFDGTVTTVDVGDALCDRFAPPAWRAIDERWARREISLPEAQRAMWSLTRATREEMEAFAGRVAAPRAGLLALLSAARDRGGRVVIASGGFDFYIRGALADLDAEVDDVYCSSARFDGDRMLPVFHDDGLACPSCAVCKGVVCERERAAGARRVVFVGDGHSDRCAVGRADGIAAIRGGALERACREAGVAHTAIDRLDEAIPLLDAPPARAARPTLT